MLVSALLSAALLTGHPAPPRASAALLAPTPPRRAILDGRSWFCDATGRCVAAGAGAPQPMMRECRRFVARFGAVSAYAREGAALGPAELARCNAAARALRLRAAAGLC